MSRKKSKAETEQEQEEVEQDKKSKSDKELINKPKEETEQEPREVEQDKKSKSDKQLTTQKEPEKKEEEQEEIKIIFPEEFEESLEQEVEEPAIFDNDNFPSFVSSDRKAPVLEPGKLEIPDTTNIEEIAETAPKTTTQGQTGYVINAPDYSGSTDYTQLSRDEQEIVTRRDREINIAPTLMRRETELSSQQHNIDFRTWQQTEGEMSRLRESNEDYEIRVREKEKKKDKLPFQ